jgi:hypothetical protein
MKMRNGANSAWISLWELDGTFIASDISLSAGTAGAPSLYFTGDTNTGIYSPGADQVAISTGGSGRLFIDSSGRVGVGTSVPSQLLTLAQTNAGSAVDCLFLNNSSNASGTAVGIAFGPNTTNDTIRSAIIRGINEAGGAGNSTGLGFFTNTNGANPSEKLRITAGGNVGIGTSSFSAVSGISGAKLQVVGGTIIGVDGLSTGGSGWLAFDSACTAPTSTKPVIYHKAGTGLGFRSDYEMSFEIGASEAIRIDNQRRVGIGTTSPGEKLAIADSGVVYTSLTGQSTTLYSVASNTGCGFFTGSAQPITFGINSSEGMRLDSSKRLLVGTSTARTNFKIGATNYTGDQQLEIGPQAFQSFVSGAAGAGGPYLMLAHQRSGSVGGNTALVNNDEMGTVSFHGADGTNLVIGATIRGEVDGTPGANDMPGRLVFSTTADGSSSPTERMRITSGGDLLVNTTTTAVSSPGTILAVGGQSFFSVAASASGVNTLHVYSSTASAYRFYVGMNGTINATNTTISAISDQRFKENIRNLDVGLNEILALQPRRFDWKEGKGKNIQNDQGFIAQEFEQVFPEMIGEWLDPAPEGEEPYKSVRADLIPVLVKAIQQQQTMISELQAKVAALEAT